MAEYLPGTVVAPTRCGHVTSALYQMKREQRMAGVWLWGAHAPSRAGNDALVIAHLFLTMRPGKVRFGESPKLAREGACAPQTTAHASSDTGHEHAISETKEPIPKAASKRAPDVAAGCPWKLLAPPRGVAGAGSDGTKLGRL